MPRPRKSLKQWILDYIEDEYQGDKSFSRPDARSGAYKLVPRGYMPSIDKMLAAWFTRAFDGVLKDAGFGFPDGREGDRIVRVFQLELPEFRELCVGKLRLAKDDIDKVRDLVERWSAEKHPTLDIDEYMADLKQAAGL